MMGGTPLRLDTILSKEKYILGGVGDGGAEVDEVGAFSSNSGGDSVGAGDVGDTVLGVLSGTLRCAIVFRTYTEVEVH